ncbi:hypothetical protein Ae201684P_007270 [Aphanomyces euteiches]|nr:hypothetical protein Ae201684P_007270 [Aphanomyces euteiches]
MKKAKVCKQLPTDIVVNVAFFIPEWMHVLSFLSALRPANVITNAPFQALLQTKLNLWVIEVWGKAGFGAVSTIVLPVLQESRVQVLKIKDPALTLENIVEITDGIQGHPTVRELIVSGDTLPFPWAKYLVQSVPREVRKVTLSHHTKYSTREHEIEYSVDDMVQLKTLAKERQIDLFWLI